MILEDFRNSIKGDPPTTPTPLLTALWHDARGQWEEAHEIAQEIETSDGAWVHAYLHRKEGDLSNARYWYGIAGRKMPTLSFEQEWEEIVSTLPNH